MSPAYHTTGRSAALHSETYGSAEIRAITVASGRFYRKPPPGFADHAAADAARRADRRPRRAAGRHAEGRRRLCPPGAERALARPGRDAAPPAAAEAGGGGGRRDLRADADDMDVAAIHGGFLQGRARGGRACCGSMPRSIDARAQGRHAGRSACATARASPPPTSSTPRAPGPTSLAALAGARAGRPGAEAAHRLHLRFARRARPRAPADGHRLRRELVHQARGRPVPGLAGRRDAVAALRRPARGDRHRHRRRAHRDGDDAARSAASRTSGRACGASSPTRTWSSATTPRSRASSGWPARAATASRPARRPGGWPPAWRWARDCPAISPNSASARRHFRRRASRSGDRKITPRRQALTSR